VRLSAGRRVVAGSSWWVLAVAFVVVGFGGGAQAQEPPAAEPTPTPSPAPAAPKRTYEVRPTTAKIAVDGVLDEAPWQEAATFTLDYETFPGDNSTPPVKTELWLTYDERSLYVAVRAQDPEPAKIRARLRDRDNAFQDDFVGVVLDTFNDERRAFEFFVNPLGVQMDMFQNDVTGNEDASWDALWASAGRLTAEGYEVEMAIPFSSLRFARAAGTQTWGIDAVRVWPRDQRRRIGLNALPRGRNCYLCNESKLSGFEGITPGRNIELDPTLTANDTRSRGDSAEPWTKDQDVDPGLTARWGVTPGMTLNAAINPDFSQVEADAAQLAVNTQFALFFPEKRPFFLEGADLFDTRINAIYTRNIADPSWGIKVTGKEGKNAFGAIVARDTRTNLLIPSSQFSRLRFLEEANTSTILRYRRDLAGSGSTIGGLLTSREGTDYHNRVLGIDSLYRWGEGEAVRIEVLGSDTLDPRPLAESLGERPGSRRGHASRLVYQHQSRTGMGYISYQDASDDFRADLGFIPQVGYRKGYGIVEKYWYADHGEHWWTRWTWAAESTWTYDSDGNPLQRQVAPYFWFNGPKQSYATAYLGLGDSCYAGECFDRNFVAFFGEFRPSGSLYLNLDGRVGQEIDYDNAQQGRILRLRPQASVNAGRHLFFDLSDNYQTLDVHGGRLFRVHLAELRATYQLNVRTFVRVITQYQDLVRDPSLYTFPVGEESRDLFNQLLFSYKLNPQTVLFLGYSDSYFGPDSQGQSLAQSNRTFFAKVGYALVF
jgi:uncharacterized protein DUF5916/cellulose/xylan binding protein with CBM9 domain